MALSMEYRKEMCEKYDWVECLLLHFIDADLDDKTDLDVIKEFVRKFDKEYFLKTLSQIDEVLKLEQFPDEWICEQTGYRLPPSRIDTQEEYKKWVSWMSEMLQAEAKKAEKL